MRLSTKLGASAATAALGAAVVLGGAGAAQAQSSDSLGSSGPAPVVLTIEGDKDGVGGTITNNTEAPLGCTVIVSDAEVIAAVEDDFGGETDLTEAFAANDTALQAANARRQNAVAGFTVPIPVAVDSTVPWTGVGAYGPDADFRAGAAVQCGTNVAFAYESGGLFGSLDMGSLGS